MRFCYNMYALTQQINIFNVDLKLIPTILFQALLVCQNPVWPSVKES
jgi:hypothetical protein